MKRQKIRNATLLISFLLFPITIFYFSPFLILVGASMGLITGSFITFTALFVISLFFGRAYCGWACPTGGLQEYCSSINDNKPSEKYNKVKYFLWVPWMALIALIFLISGGFKGIDPLFATQNGISISEPVLFSIYYGIIGLVLIVAFAGGKRASCHYICWMAPFMVIGTKIKNLIGLPSLNLIADGDKCASCKSCTKNCTMGLDVGEMVKKGNMENSECILCGICIDSCKKEAIEYSFHK